MEMNSFNNFLDNYNIEDDEIYQDFMSTKPNITENTRITYKKALKDFCNANELPLKVMYANCKEEQVDEVVNNKIIKFSPNDINTCTKQYFNNFLQYIEVNKSPYKTERNTNRGSTINQKVALLQSFFDKYQLDLPSYEKRSEDDSKDWKPLTKKDIEYIVNDSTLEQNSLWTFMMSTGMREIDCVNWKIRDFMEATEKMGYHNFVDVEEFIDKAPQDMIGFWDFIPIKTKKDNIRCMTFNNRESSNYILQSLRKIKNDYLPKYNKKHGTNLKISKDSALFGSRTYQYLGHKGPNSVTAAAHKKNKKLRKHYLTQMEDKIRKGELSEEDRDKYIEEIPIFHGHQLRRYFISTIRRHASNISYSAMMEGHAPALSNDPSYLNIRKEDVEETYMKAIYELSLFEIDADKIFDSKAEELKIELAEKEARWKEELKNKDKEMEDLKQEFEKKLNETKNELKREFGSKITKAEIKTIVTNYFYENYRDDMIKDADILSNPDSDIIRRCTVIKELAYEFALEDESNFNQESAYLDSLVKKAIIRVSLNPDIVGKYNEIYNNSLNQSVVNEKINNIVNDIIVFIGNNKTLWELVKDNQEKLKNNIVTHLIRADYDLENLDTDEKKKIAEEVMLDMF